MWQECDIPIVISSNPSEDSIDEFKMYANKPVISAEFLLELHEIAGKLARKMMAKSGPFSLESY